jgi:hypothetical protein
MNALEIAARNFVISAKREGYWNDIAQRCSC